MGAVSLTLMIQLFLLKTACQVFLLPLHRVICDAATHTGDYLNNKTQFSCFCFVSASHIQVGPDYVQAVEVFVCTVSADLCFISGDSPFI